MKCHLLRILAHLYYAIDLVVEDHRFRAIAAFLFLGFLFASSCIYYHTDSLLVAILLPTCTVIGGISGAIFSGYLWRKTGPFIYGKSEECDRL